MLALALAISCLAMVQFTVSAEGSNGVRVSIAKNGYIKTGDGYLTNSLGYTDTYTGWVHVGYYVRNMGSNATTVALALQTTARINQSNGTAGNVWASYNGSETSITLAGGEGSYIGFTMYALNGKVNGTYTDVMGKTQDIALSKFFIRFNGSEADLALVPAKESVDELKTNLGFKELVQIDGVPANFAKTPINGDAENGKTGWKSFSAAGGTVTQVEGGANGTDHAIKFTPGENQYDSVGFDLSNAILPSALGFSGDGAHAYKLTFWAKAEKGKDGVFKVVINSQNHGDDRFTQGPQFTMTDKWKKFETNVTISHTFIKKILNDTVSTKNQRTLELILRLDASGEDRAFKDGTFAYFVDEVTIEPDCNAGVSITTCESTSELNTRPVLTGGTDFTALALSAQNGKVTTTFRVYNLSNAILHLELSLQNRDKWTYLELDGKKHFAEANVNPYSYEDITYEFDINGDGNVTDEEGTIIGLDKVWFRADVKECITGTDPAVFASAGKELVIVPLSNPEILSEMQSMKASVPGAFTTKSVYDGYALTSLNLDSGKTLDFNFYAAFASADAGENATVNIYRGDKKVSTLTGNNEVGTLRYKFTYADIAPQSMADKITAELVVGEKVIATKTESIKSYCEKVRATADGAKYKTFMADMLNYGQALSDYKNLGKTIVGETDTWIADSKTDFENIKDKLVSVRKVETVNDENNKIKSAGLYFYDINKIYFRAEINGGVVKINGESPKMVKDDKYYTDGIAATKFADVYTVTAEVNGKEVHEVTYSVNSYVLAKCEGDAAINVLARALGCYGYSATQLNKGEVK